MDLFQSDRKRQRISLEEGKRKILFGIIFKLMTMLIDDGEVVTIPVSAIDQEGDSGLMDGESFTFQNLADLTLVTSSNDGAYAVAVAGGEDIKCAKYATYGTSELSRNIIKALNGRSACLIENHGQVSFSNSLSEAFELAQEVEYLSEQYLGCLRTGKPKILSKSQMQKVLLKVKNYKQD